MENIKLVTENLLNTGTVSITGEETSYPSSRLYDADRNDLWRYYATGSIVIEVTLATSKIGRASCRERV